MWRPTTMSEEDQERLEDYKGPGRYKATSQASSCLQLPLFALLWQENLVLPNALNFLLEEIQVECGLMLDFCISLFQVYCACYNTGNILHISSISALQALQCIPVIVISVFMVEARSFQCARYANRSQSTARKPSPYYR